MPENAGNMFSIPWLVSVETVLSELGIALTSKAPLLLNFILFHLNF
jgi:hypothetical protein